jgi:hypothetical protein
MNFYEITFIHSRGFCPVPIQVLKYASSMVDVLRSFRKSNKSMRVLNIVEYA